MKTRLLDRGTFLLERFVLRGMHYRLALVAALIGLVSVVGGGLGLLLGAGFEGFGEAVWWSFLRLTDPGYLGDDVGAARRTISTIVTVLGYVIFLGALIAIMTQWFMATIRRLESGLTPIRERGHVVVLGWTNRTPAVVTELFASEGRVRRFLARRGERRLKVVVLAEEVTAELRQDLRERLGARWNERQITFRSGSSLRTEHLERVDYLRAAALLLPGSDFAPGGVEQIDTHVVKTLLSVSRHAGDAGTPPPFAVAALFDARKVPVAEHAYEGPLEVVAGDAIIARLIAQNVRHPGLSFVYSELLTQSAGNEIYVRRHPELAGQPFGTLAGRFQAAVLLGLVRAGSMRLNPEPALRLEPEDALVFVARAYEACAPGAGDEAALEGPAAAPARVTAALATPPRRLLVLGWSRKVPSVLREFAGYASERFEIDVVSVVPAREREEQLARYGLAPERIALRQLEADYTLPAELARLDPAAYDHAILLASDWLGASEETDARTILGTLLLRELLGPRARPALLVELMDPENLGLFRRRRGEVLLSPVLLSHMLSQVVLRRELAAVFDELFGPGGSEIFFREAGPLGLAGRPIRFADLQAVAGGRGEVALGFRKPDAEDSQGGLVLNPDRAAAWTLEATDELVVLART